MSMLQAGILGQHEVKRIRQPEGKWYRGNWIYNEAPEEEIIKCSAQEMSKVTRSAQALSHDEVYAKRIDYDINRHPT